MNCTGWGAKHLVKDDPETATMPLLAGHVVLMDCPAVQHGMLFHGKPFEGRSIYIVPRSGSTNDVLCGGTALLTEPLPDMRQSLKHLQADHHDQILARVIATTPALGAAKELSRGTGLRPVRSSLRLGNGTATTDRLALLRPWRFRPHALLGLRISCCENAPRAMLNPKTSGSRIQLRDNGG